ncbi:MAG: hypothetical protein JJE51_10260 [Thermoanaerobaculia bacterium]|nr:hypothetical protein [Thermoanaerobaculia bacterium]
MNLRRIVVFALLSIGTLSAFAGNYRWTVPGPDGGVVTVIAFDPADPSIVHAASPNGLFRSSDGGLHWTAAQRFLGMEIQDIAVSKSDSSVVLASTAYGLFKSSDRGVSWAIVHPWASFGVALGSTSQDVISYSTSGPMRSTDGGVTFAAAGTGLPAGSYITEIVFDPQDSNTAYLSLGSTGGVYKTVDGGATWNAANSGLTGDFFYSLAIDPSNGSTLYTGSREKIFKSTDGGTSWSALSLPFAPSTPVYSLAISNSSPPTLVAGTSEGAFVTTNGGAAWASPAALRDLVIEVAVDPVNPANILAIEMYRLYRSSDGGANAIVADSGLTAQYVYSIVPDRFNEAVVYTTTPSGVLKSVNRGVTWTSIGSSANFLDLDADSSALYATLFGIISKSVDGGTTWTGITSGLPPGSVSGLVADPQVSGTLYLTMGSKLYKKVGDDPWVSRSEGLPVGFQSFLAVDPRQTTTIYFGNEAGLFKSVDGAVSWLPIGPAGQIAAGIAVDPHESNHLFVWNNNRTWESKDGGATWTEMVVPFTGARLVFDRTRPGRVFASGYTTVHQSADGGKTWFPLNDGFGVAHGGLFAISADGNTLYSGGEKGGLWQYHFGRRRGASR